MAFATGIALLVAFLLLQPLSATSDFLSPLLSPFFDDVCKEVECGKGTCKPSKNSTFPFECECDQGWKQALASHDDSGLKFLPCIIPNCTLNYSCSKAPAPAPEKARKANGSIFDACHWVDCGGGSCNKTSTPIIVNVMLATTISSILLPFLASKNVLLAWVALTLEYQ